MRRVLVALCLGAALETVLIAQLPQIPGPASKLLSRLPTLDSLTRGTPPLTTGFNDALGPVPLPIGNSCAQRTI